MPRPLSPADAFEKNILSTPHPWRWLLEVELPTDPPTRYRFIDAPESVEFGTTSGGDALVYSSFPFRFSPPRMTTAGDTESAHLVVGNVSREVSSALENHEGLVGQELRVLLVNSTQLAQGPSGALFDDTFLVLSVDANESVATFKLGQFSSRAESFPRRLALRDFCTVAYKGLECGYLGLIPACDKSFDGTNGCIVHGDDEVATGGVRRHPARFGAARGLPRVGVS